jgi:hypothetical protein
MDKPLIETSARDKISVCIGAAIWTVATDDLEPHNVQDKGPA